MTAVGTPGACHARTSPLHDLRHTFGVHCAQAGVPIVRLQKLLGHASPHMTLRYMKHAPESYFQEDAAKVAASISGERNREAEAQAAPVRPSGRSRLPGTFPTFFPTYPRRRMDLGRKRDCLTCYPMDTFAFQAWWPSG